MAKAPAVQPVARLAVRLTPRGGRDAIDGWIRDADGAPCLKVRVSSPPVEGAANEALERLIAATLKVPASAVRIVAGHQARVKRLEIAGADAADLARVLGTP
ncbi:DUF167 domain-containing protein [Methylobacterium sp. J-076]|uniref:DUF167 domain-containing protein n=1 Tax=Methylobacterium sp. J-076 TaxID=2836655 RepID=UPI001FB95626|nr:DUF167 family protein [Methylobacterium sp. J-076]MCJ2015627.1 DUF167 family protein [Methylobacterium sp. J-076]